MEAFLPYLVQYGPLGLGIGLLAWVIKGAIPHIANAIVKDRDNKRKHAREMVKIDDAIKRRKEKRARSQKSKGEAA